MAQNMPSGPTRLGPEGYVAPTPRPSLALLLPQLATTDADPGSQSQQRTRPQLTLSLEA